MKKKMLRHIWNCFNTIKLIVIVDELFAVLTGMSFGEKTKTKLKTEEVRIEYIQTLSSK